MYNLVLGLIVIATSLLIARFIGKRWGKITVLILGAIAAGALIFYPSITLFMRSRQAPDDAEILGLLYGGDADIQEGLDGESLYIVEELSTVEKEQFSYAAQVNTQIVSKVSGWEQKPQKVLVLTRTGPPACCDRSQLPVLGGALLSWENGAWQVGGYQKLIMPYGGFDRVEAREIVAIGPQKTTVVLGEQVLRNGVIQTWDLLLGEVDGHLKVIGRIETGADNKENCPPTAEDESCWSYSAAYEFVQGVNPDYDNIVIRTSGTKIVDGVLVSFEETAKLVFSNGEYRIVDDG